MKISKKNLEKLIKEEVDKALLSERNTAEDIQDVLEKNGVETAIRYIAVTLKQMEDQQNRLIDVDIKRLYDQVKALTGRKF